MPRPILRITKKDSFGWHSIIWGKSLTLQCFRSVKECQQWLAETTAIRKIKYGMPNEADIIEESN